MIEGIREGVIGFLSFWGPREGQISPSDDLRVFFHPPPHIEEPGSGLMRDCRLW